MNSVALINPKMKAYGDVILAIAHACHEANRIYYASIGIEDTDNWEELEDWQRKGVLAGVRFHLANPSATAEDSHNMRCKVLRSQGWSYGPIKSAEMKMHPCLVDFDQLTPIQIKKNLLFVEVIRSLESVYSRYMQ